MDSIPPLRFLQVSELEVRLVDQVGRSQGLSGAIRTEVLPGKAVELSIKGGRHLAERIRVAISSLLKQGNECWGGVHPPSSGDRALDISSTAPVSQANSLGRGVIRRQRSMDRDRPGLVGDRVGDLKEVFAGKGLKPIGQQQRR